MYFIVVAMLLLSKDNRWLSEKKMKLIGLILMFNGLATMAKGQGESMPLYGPVEPPKHFLTGVNLEGEFASGILDKDFSTIPKIKDAKVYAAGYALGGILYYSIGDFKESNHSISLSACFSKNYYSFEYIPSDTTHNSALLAGDLNEKNLFKYFYKNTIGAIRFETDYHLKLIEFKHSGPSISIGTGINIILGQQEAFKLSINSPNVKYRNDLINDSFIDNRKSLVLNSIEPFPFDTYAIYLKAGVEYEFQINKIIKFIPSISFNRYLSGRNPLSDWNVNSYKVSFTILF
ncbi:MAG: hypothetical protein NT007_04220 [Candidatus Kapabacteria bacterium]|nr:hypothetical protein [Candidatus Kapabacteria bacterium]